MNDPGDDLLRLKPYLADISEALIAAGEGAEREGMVLDVPLLAALTLRETVAGWGPGYSPKGDPRGTGDGGRGHGLFQIDAYGPFAHFIPARGQPWPVADQAAAALAALRAGRHELRAFRSHPLFARAVAASYNAGSPKVAAALRAGKDPDSVTAKGPSKRPDYGSHVLSIRASLLTRYPSTFPGGSR